MDNRMTGSLLKESADEASFSGNKDIGHLLNGDSGAR
jgi:hypothetical protein